MSDLIRSKFQLPPKPTNIVSRPRLLMRFDTIPHPKLVLVSAPAGFGKTVAIACGVHEHMRQTAWLSLDDSDNDPVRFWAYVFSALETAGVEFSPEIAQLAASDSSTVVTTLVNRLVGLSQPIFLVLDDYHVITDQYIHSAIEMLLNHMPVQVTLVIATRADPPFRLGQMRARSEMIELRAADLRFSAAEVSSFLCEIMGLSLDQDQIVALEQRTEGWPAGLQLAGVALRGHADRDRFIDDFTGSHHYVVEYLTEEVVHQQTADVQHFLLNTAHLHRFCDSLCDAVTLRRDSQQMLDDLRARNLFVVPLDVSGTWYRYHHLFADLLRHLQGQQLDADATRALHERASEWHQSSGDLPEAIGYALRGGSYQTASTLLEDYWHIALHRGELHTVRRWLTSLPDHVVSASAPLNMAYCWLHHLAGETEAIDARLTQVCDTWSRLEKNNAIPDREAWIILPSLMQTVAAILALQRGDPQSAANHALQAIAVIPQDDRVKRDLLVGSANYRLAQAYRELERFEDAISVMLDVIDQLKRTTNIIGLVRGVYDTVHLYLGLDQLDSARALCDSIQTQLAQRGHDRFPLVGLLHIAHAEIALAAGHTEVAREHLRQAEALAGSGQYAPLESHLNTLRSRFAERDTQRIPLSEPLTEREVEVLQLLSAGYSNQQVADKLVITEDTVKRHNTHIYGKLNVSNRTQAVLRAQELGLL